MTNDERKLKTIGKVTVNLVGLFEYFLLVRQKNVTHLCKTGSFRK